MARTILISGAASGIGEALSRLFAGDHERLVLLDRSGDRLERLREEIRASTADCAVYPVDLRDAAAVQQAVDDGVARFGPLDVVCPNAGIGFPEVPLAETPVDNARDMVDVNLLGAFHLLRAAVPHLGAGGAVVITSSISGQQAHPGAAMYAATKIALIGLGRSLAMELAPRRIRVNMVCPGGVDTPMLDTVYGSGRSGTVAEYEGLNPLGRIARPEDVARAIRFLASPEARQINGVALRVDGGDSLMGAI